MQPTLHTGNKAFITAIILLFAGLAVFALTGEFIATLPAFAMLYCMLIVYDFKTAYWILLLLIPLSTHIEFLNNSFSLSLPSEPVMWLFYTLSIMLMIYKRQSLPVWFVNNPVTIIVLLQLLWLIVAVICSQVILLSTKFLIAKTWYLVCFFVIPVWLIKNRKDIKTIFLLWLIPILITIVIILIRHASYGFTFFNIDAAVGTLYYKHVDYASVLSMFYPLVFAAYIISRKTYKRLSILLFLLNLLFITAIILSYTRAAMGAVVFSFIVAYAIRLKLANYIIPVFYAVTLATFLFFAIDNKFLQYHPHFEETYMHHEFGDHLKATMEGKDMSSVERLYRWIAAVRMSIDKPLTGYGPHSFYYYYKPYALSLYRTYVSENYERSTTHNYFLYMLVEQGLPAMLLYALLVIIVFARAQLIYHRFTDPFYKNITLGIAMSFAVFFINNLFSELLETDKIGPLTYLSLSLLVILDHKSRNIQQAHSQ